MALTEDQKKLLIGGGIGALALAVGFGIFGGKAAAGPGRQPDRSLPPQQGVPSRGLARKRKKRHRDDMRGERDENDRGEYGQKKHRRRHHGD